MKLTMKNIGVIRDAEIELDGITVLAGLNGTGKSTVCKSLYSVTASYLNLSERVAEERKKSVEDVVISSLILPLYREGDLFLTPVSESQLYSDLASQRLPIPERYEDWVKRFPELRKGKDSAFEKETFPKFLEKLRAAVNRSEAEYVAYLANKVLWAAFDAQINTIGVLKPGEIALTAGRETRRMKIEGNKITECDEKEINAFRPVYLDTRHVLDGVNYRVLDELNTTTQSVAPYHSGLYNLMKSSYSPRSIEEQESRERVLALIAPVIHGKLIVSAFGEFMFKDDRFSEPISLRNVASGNKTFAVLQRLIESGAFRENNVLIIDEPESNQHPQWQLKLAETLVLLHKELGVRLFLNTHSAYFLRAVEVYADEYEVSNHCHYYQTQTVDDNESLFNIRNVDGQTELIYRDFYMPFEEL